MSVIDDTVFMQRSGPLKFAMDGENLRRQDSRHRTGVPDRSIKQLSDRHREIARLCLLGWANVDIAEHLGISADQVSTIVSSEAFKAHLKDLNSKRDQQTVEVIGDLVDKAALDGARVLRNILAPGTSESLMAPLDLKVKVAQDMLDREGSKPKISRSTSQSIHMHVTADDLEEIKKSRRSWKEDVVDV